MLQGSAQTVAKPTCSLKKEGQQCGLCCAAVLTKAVLWQVHATLELFALIVVVFELSMKMRWLGFQTFIRHKRTMVKVSCLLDCQGSPSAPPRPKSQIKHWPALRQG